MILSIIVESLLYNIKCVERTIFLIFFISCYINKTTLNWIESNGTEFLHCMFGGLKVRLSNLITLLLGVNLVGVIVLASFAFGGTLHKEDGIAEEEDNL